MFQKINGTIIFWILLAIFCSGTKCANVSEIKAVDPNYGVTWMFFPGENDTPEIIDLTQENQMRGGDQKFWFGDPDRDSKITMYLYRKGEPPRYLKKGNNKDRDEFELDDKYDPGKPTKIIIHGWQNDQNSPAIQLIKDEYLQNQNVNVIGVDWSPMAHSRNYFLSADATRDVGRHVASVIDHMVTEKNANIDDIHIIGHSLGAHTAGYAGMYTTSGKVGRITGLDPALPAFQDINRIEQRLDSTDARFVDVIHTCSGILGHNHNLGHADFYPNGGKAAQPGCDTIQDFIGACSHGRAYRYFAESIRTRNGFMAQNCSSFEDYKYGNCFSDSPVPMGEALPRRARGNYYLETLAGPKFARLIKIHS